MLSPSDLSFHLLSENQISFPEDPTLSLAIPTAPRLWRGKGEGITIHGYRLFPCSLLPASYFLPLASCLSGSLAPGYLFLAAFYLRSSVLFNLCKSVFT
jgi:hypothetical protein